MLGIVAGLAAAADSSYVTQMATGVNAYRARSALPALTLDPGISAIAAAHSEDMARAGKLGHDGFARRVEASGLPMCVENVGWNYPSAQAQLDAWRNSPGHDRNLRDRRAERMGIGVAKGYVTLIACGP